MTVTTARAPAPVTPAAPRRRRLGAGGAAWILAAPFCLLFLAFTAWPVLQSLFMSFTDTRQRDLRTPFAVDFVGPRQLHQALQ